MMETSCGEEQMVPAATGRRLRTRLSQINYYCAEDIVEDDERDSRVSHTKNRGCKRKAEVNIESLYRQENYQEISSTPLETIYESPHCSRGGKRTNRGRGSNNDKLTYVETDTDLSLMAAKKLKRICLFASHYNPSKQKIRHRKERARKMKQTKGVKIPKGTTISVEDLEAVLACLSDDEDDQIENNQNVTNSKFPGVVSDSGFYVGNITRADTSDAVMEDITQDMDALTVNKSQVHADLQSRADHTVKAQMLEQFLPLPIFDEPPLSHSFSSREKKLRRRSGRLLGCVLPPVERTLEAILDEEQCVADVQCCHPSTLTILSPVNNSSTPEILHESSTTVEIDSVVAEPKESAGKKPLKPRQRKKNVINCDDDKGSEHTNEQRIVAKKRAKQRKPQHEEGKKVKKLEMGTKRQNKSEVDKRIKKRRDYEVDGVNSIGEKTLSMNYPLVSQVTSEVVTLPCDKARVNRHDEGAVKPNRGSNRRGTRRLSGKQQPLYHTFTKPTSLNLDVNNSLDKSLDLIEAAELNPSNSVESSMPPPSLVNTAQEAVMVCTSPTGAPSDGVVCCRSPTSPSTRLAALTLHTDKSSSPSSLSLHQSPASTQINKNINRKLRRRSARLVIETVNDVKLRKNFVSSFGSYWSAASPPCCTKKVVNVDINTSGAAPVRENTNSYPLDLTVFESQFEERCNAKAATGRRGISKRGNKTRCNSGMSCNQKSVVAEQKLKGNDVMNISGNTLNCTVVVNERHPHIAEQEPMIPGVTELDNQALLMPTKNSIITSVPTLSTCAARTPPTNALVQSLFDSDNTVKGTKAHDPVYNIKSQVLQEVLSHCDVPHKHLSSGDSQQGVSRHNFFDHDIKVTENLETHGALNLHQEDSNLVPVIQAHVPVLSTVSSRVCEPHNNLMTTSYSVITAGTSRDNLDGHIPSSKSEGCLLSKYISDDMAWGPVISGVFENKVGIRLGKTYQNKAVSRNITNQVSRCVDSLLGDPSSHS
ncbi:uncharacterized protein LOC121869026 isoform X1 [Homarus americanus]|uniref:Uncharacterized protein n=1 Tax=Homarus americanus TaxID=6706 RepID=A0A8J5K521_HOMAM|nr:uncharacterized protein LOC121869026 isoform X1 [Homarus americanus]XP_042226036.1 uncharacterized protein LOC121869026 isoform X1 [Homarus americanus]KAG7166783.1 hypothetical protein Hamer_G010445 [Homarus americanus]